MSTSEGTGSERVARTADPGTPADPPVPAEARAPDPGQGRPSRARQVAVGAIVLVFMVAGVVVPLALLGGAFHGSPTPEPTGGAEGGGSASPMLPDTAVVACTDQGTEVLTPVVRPQPDGIHFRTDNRTDSLLTFDFEGTQGGGFGTNAPPGAHPVEEDAGWPLPPGTVQVRCADSDDPNWPDTPFATLTLEDPDGLWMPGFQPEGCDTMSMSNIDYAQDAAGEQGDPVDLAKGDLADTIEAGDEVRAAGYPEADLPTVAVVRDGRVVAVAEYFEAPQGGWLLGGVTACSE
jgi:hypothetical protein